MAKNDKAKTASALTKDAKAMIQLAFEDLGGLPRLVSWANNPANLPQFYTQIWAKIIPKDIKSEVTGKDGGPLQMHHMNTKDLKNLTEEELNTLEHLVSKCGNEQLTES